MADVISTKEAEHYIWGGDCDGWHLLKSKGLSIIQERVPPGRSEVRHYHLTAHQFFYVLSGVATLELNGETLTIKAGEGCAVPAKAVHQLRNQTEEDITFLVCSAPPSHGDRVVLEQA